jgi:hypothetical protein
MKQEQRDALLQDLQPKLQRAAKLLEQSHDTERFGGIGKYKLLIVIATYVLFFWNDSSYLWVTLGCCERTLKFTVLNGGHVILFQRLTFK